MISQECTMVQTTEAIYSNGVLKPTHPLPLKEHQRVRITIESVEPPGSRQVAIGRMTEGFEKLRLRTNGKPPSREELYERG
jgi:predicted DNA-binding antitoxin AbrB/MazE fold protein